MCIGLSTDGPKFSVRGWVSAEVFRRLLSIADYVGREYGRTIFRLSKNKILAKGMKVDDVLGILDDSGVEYDDDLIEYLEGLLKKRRGNVVLSYDGEKIFAKFSTYLGELYKDELRDILSYDRKSRMFYTLPFRYRELRSKLQDLGFEVEDLTGFSMSNPLPRKISFRGELRDYQVEAVKEWLRNHGRGIIALPTGSGKTIIGVAALTEINEKALIIAYTKEQLMQWRRSILRFTDAEASMIGLYYSREKRIAPITLATYQTAYKHMGKLAPHFNYLIIDEVHHLPAEKFKYIATMSPARYRMGLSATPYREDGKHTYLFPLMGGVVYYKTPQELAEKGYLAKHKIITVKVQLKPEEKKRYLQLKEKFKNLAGYVKFDQIVEAAKRGDWRAINALRIHSEMRQIFQKSRAKIEKVKEIAEEELRKGRKIIIFAHYVDLAETIAREIGGYLLTGNTSDEERKKILEEFRTKKSGALVVTTVGDEGLDIPDASVGILVAGTGSRRQFIQRLGRLLRPGPGKEAVLYEIVARGTSEEVQARKRKRIKLDELAGVDEGSNK